MPKQRNHQSQTPNFREMVSKQIKAVMAGIGNDRQAKSERSSFRGIIYGVDIAGILSTDCRTPRDDVRIF